MKEKKHFRVCRDCNEEQRHQVSCFNSLKHRLERFGETVFRLSLEPARSSVIIVEQCILYVRWSCAHSNTTYIVVDLSDDVKANLAEWGGECVGCFVA